MWGFGREQLGSEHGSEGLSPPTQLRQLEMQLEQEYEEKQMVLHEKQDLEGLVGTLCEQVRGWCPGLLAATSWPAKPLCWLCPSSKHCL